mmetsp:Transcript_96120/g.250611  ORF Transcript_96120/g.250611 Transcript_96120/m.250611 type:complete len:228 (-) Transcript_96120:109-792(-)
MSTEPPSTSTPFGRCTTECSSLATADLLDLALGYHHHLPRTTTGGIGTMDSLPEMSTEPPSTSTPFGRNVEKTALQYPRAGEVGENGGDAEEEDPQAKWLARKARLSAKKHNDGKKGKVTYGLFLRQQQVGDEAANTPSTGSCGRGVVGSSSGVAAGGSRSGLRTPPESTLAADSVDGETLHEKWRRRKLERAEVTLLKAKNVSRILAKQSSASMSILPGFVDQAKF